MRTRWWKTNWLAPVVAVAVVGSTLMATTTYLDLERTIQEQTAVAATLDRLSQDQQLSAALKSIHEGQADAAAQRLDLMLCQSILQLNAELPFADARTRARVEDAFRRIALLRPKTGLRAAGGTAQEYSEDQAAAERILAVALGSAQTAQAR